MDENAPFSPPPPGSPPATPVPPPPLIAATVRPQAAPRRGRGWMVFAIILLVLLAVSVLFNIGSFASMMTRGTSSHYYARTSGPRLDEVIVEDNDAANKIAVVDVDGIITGRVMDQGGHSMVELIRAQLKRAEEDDRVKAVILKVDSPGGEVLAADEIYRALNEFQQKSRKPVVASMGSLAASGGYYVSAPCRWIVANEMTITGSIGVIMSSYNYRGLMNKVGVLPQTYKSGKFKDMLSGSREPESITQQERDMVQGLIDETFDRFRSIVKEGRDSAYQQNKTSKSGETGRALSNDWKEYADGRVLSGREAFRLGFVDELGSFEKAVSRTKHMVGIRNANLVQYQQRYDISDLFKLFGKSEARTTVKVDLGLEVPKLQAGQLYFLAPTFVQ